MTVRFVLGSVGDVVRLLWYRIPLDVRVYGWGPMRLKYEAAAEARAERRAAAWMAALEEEER